MPDPYAARTSSLPPMKCPGLHLLSAALLCLSISSCSILAIPFKMLRSVAWAGKKGYDAASAPFKKSEEDKIAEKTQEQDDKKKKEEDDKQKNSGLPQLPPDPQQPPVPQGQTPPLPQNMQLPQEPLPGTEPPLPESFPPASE